MMTYCQLAKNFPCQEFADGYPTLDEGTRKGRCFAIATDLNIVLYVYTMTGSLGVFTHLSKLYLLQLRENTT